MHDKEFLARLTPYQGENRLLSYAHFVLVWVIMGSLLAMGLWTGSLALQLGAGVLLGLVQVRLFIIFHDYLHHAIFRSPSPLLRFALWLSGQYLATPTTIWRTIHDIHHARNGRRHFSYVGSFKVMTPEEFRATPPRERSRYLFGRSAFAIANGYFFMFLHGLCFLPFKNSPRKQWGGLTAIVLHAGMPLLALATGLFPEYLLLWFVPAWISSAIGTYLFYVQHNFPQSCWKPDEEWSFVHAALQGSSHLDLGPMAHWFTGNIGYHHIHHLSHRIPFYRLPQVYRELPELNVDNKTSLMPRDVAKCLRLKFWDPSRQRMITLREYRERYERAATPAAV